MKSPLSRVALVAVALMPLASCGAAAVAHAAGASSFKPVSIHVSYSDLNANSTAGAAHLYQRIEGAARVACGQPSRDLAERTVWQACYDTAVRDAVARIDSPAVTALYTGHSGNNVTAMRR